MMLRIDQLQEAIAVSHASETQEAPRKRSKDDEEENEDEDEERFTDDGRLEVRPTFLPALFLNRSMFIGSFHDITEPSFEPAYTLPPATASDVIDLLAPRRK